MTAWARLTRSRAAADSSSIERAPSSTVATVGPTFDRNVLFRGAFSSSSRGLADALPPPQDEPDELAGPEALEDRERGDMHRLLVRGVALRGLWSLVRKALSTAKNVLWRRQAPVTLLLSADHVAALKAAATRACAATTTLVSSNDAVLAYCWALARACRGRSGGAFKGMEPGVQFMIQTVDIRRCVGDPAAVISSPPPSIRRRCSSCRARACRAKWSHLTTARYFPGMGAYFGHASLGIVLCAPADGTARGAGLAAHVRRSLLHCTDPRRLPRAVAEQLVSREAPSGGYLGADDATSAPHDAETGPARHETSPEAEKRRAMLVPLWADCVCRLAVPCVSKQRLRPSTFVLCRNQPWR